MRSILGREEQPTYDLPWTANIFELTHTKCQINYTVLYCNLYAFIQ
jgi:hypothetical protein